MSPDRGTLRPSHGPGPWRRLREACSEGGSVTAAEVQRTYLVLVLGNTLAASLRHALAGALS